MNRVEFEHAAEEVVGELAASHPELSWVVAAHEQDLWIPLALVDPTYAPLLEIPIPWHHTHGSKMVTGEGPRVAPRTDDVPAYRSAPTNRELTVRSFIGAPIETTDGRIPAVLCGWAPVEQAEDFADLLPTVEARAADLAALLPTDLWEF